MWRCLGRRQLLCCLVSLPFDRAKGVRVCMCVSVCVTAAEQLFLTRLTRATTIAQSPCKLQANVNETNDTKPKSRPKMKPSPKPNDMQLPELVETETALTNEFDSRQSGRHAAAAAGAAAATQRNVKTKAISPSLYLSLLRSPILSRVNIWESEFHSPFIPSACFQSFGRGPTCRYNVLFDISVCRVRCCCSRRSGYHNKNKSKGNKLKEMCKWKNLNLMNW